MFSKLSENIRSAILAPPKEFLPGGGWVVMYVICIGSMPAPAEGGSSPVRWGRKHKVKTKNLLRVVVATLVTGAMGLAGVGSAMAADTRIDASKLGERARQTLTVTANEDISNRTLKAVPLAYYS